MVRLLVICVMVGAAVTVAAVLGYRHRVYRSMQGINGRLGIDEKPTLACHPVDYYRRVFDSRLRLGMTEAEAGEVMQGADEVRVLQDEQGRKAIRYKYAVYTTPLIGTNNTAYVFLLYHHGRLSHYYVDNDP